MGLKNYENGTVIFYEEELDPALNKKSEEDK
jgi:hypothetical protein